MENKQKLFWLWLISVVLCWGIEIATQRAEKIIGIGIIAAIFLSVTFLHDFNSINK
jgi:hypothetical protein